MAAAQTTPCGCGNCPPCRWRAEDEAEQEVARRLERLAHLVSEWGTEAYHLATAGDLAGAGRAAAQARRFAEKLELEGLVHA